MNILITGGGGFIGSNLAARFSKNHTVVVYDSLDRPGSEKNIAWLSSLRRPSLLFVRGNINDRPKLAGLVADADAVFHLAAQVAVTSSVTNPRMDFEVNALGTFNLLEAVRESGRRPLVTYASTNKVYGELHRGNSTQATADRRNAKNIPVNEEQPLDFYSPYACSKGAADCYVHDYSRIFGIPTVVFRKSCIYGVRQYGTEDQGWVAHFVRQVLSDNPITIYGNGGQIRDLLYIDDLVALYEKALENRKDKADGQIFNVGGGTENAVSLIDVIGKIRTILKRNIVVNYAPERPGDQPYYVSDISKAHAVLGWKPVVSVDEGLKRLIDWVQTDIAV